MSVSTPRRQFEESGRLRWHFGDLGRIEGTHSLAQRNRGTWKCDDRTRRGEREGAAGPRQAAGQQPVAELCQEQVSADKAAVSSTSQARGAGRSIQVQ
jgi:hypothetical protein